MNKVFALLFSTMFILVAQAQVSKTIEGLHAGMLGRSLTTVEVSSVTTLTLIGTMDARDFKFMRDSMPSLTFLDLKETVVEAYNGYDGTGSYLNPANVIPNSSFNLESYIGVSKLQRLVLPKTIIETGSKAFANCVALEELIFPSTLKVLGDYAFQNCTSIKQVQLPDSLISIGANAFYKCSVTQINLPNSLNIIKFNAFMNCLSLTELSVPNSVTTIEQGAFYNCTGMQSIRLGSGLTSLGMQAFYNCNRLMSIYVGSDVPAVVNSYTRAFDYVDKAKCVLHVPYGTYSAYANAHEWKSFTKIVEDSLGILPNTHKIRIPYSEGSKAGMRILSNQSWTVTSNQSWLVASPKSGIGNDSITFTASNNPNLNIRDAIITFTTAERAPKSVTVTQSATPKVLTLQAGELATSLTTREFSSISELVLKGSMNNRDFLIIRDSMPRLEKLNLAEVHILAAPGLPGQVYTTENQIPYSALYNSVKNNGHGLLAEIILPSSCTSIAQNAFRSCKRLVNIVIPENVRFIYSDVFSSCTSLEKVSMVGHLKSIGEHAFAYCNKLSEVLLGDSLESMKYNCFSDCSSLKKIVLPASLKTLGNSSFISCSALEEIVIPDNVTELASNCFNSCIRLTKITLGKNLTSIRDYALQGCTSLVSISIPKTVINIEGWAFAACTGLTSIYANAFNPVDLSNWYGVFDYVDKLKCTLYVPMGSKTLYANSVRWKDFKTIVELETVLSAATKKELYLYPNPVNSSFQLIGLDQKIVVTILDMQGRVCLKVEVDAEDKISTEALPKGTYLLRMTTLLGNHVLKFVKI